MSLPFSREEYAQRLAQVQAAMRRAGTDALLVADPSNIYWLTGVEDWCFYTPQFVLVIADGPNSGQPYWIGRAMDAAGARTSCWMEPARVLSYPEQYVQQAGSHPADHIGGVLADLGLARARIGYESDSYFFSPRSLQRLQQALPAAAFVDQDLMVNWLRAVKSPAEIAYMRQAALIAETAMRTAYETIAPGVRQCDVMAEVMRVQIAPSPDFGGDMTGLSPIVLAGEKASTAHPAWTDEPFHDEQTVALELGGCRRRYNCGLARTLHLGRAVPALLRDTAAAVREGLDAVLGTARPGAAAHALHSAWQDVLARHNLAKESRIGYSIGVGFSPDWGEHTISLRQGDETVLQAGMTFHVILGMWQQGWGMELSETILVTRDGAECLTRFPRDIFLKS